MSDDDGARPQRERVAQHRYSGSPGGARAAWNRDFSSEAARRRSGPTPFVRAQGVPATFGRAEGVAGAFATSKAKATVAGLIKLSSNAGDFEAREFVERVVEPEILRLTHEAASANAREAVAVREARKAKRKADSATRLLALSTMQRHKQHQAIDELVGTGFTSDRTLRRHADMWCSRIQAEYDGDTKKQVMLATAVAERLALKAHSARTPAEQRAVNSIIASLQHFYETVRSRYAGRYPNDVRAVWSAVNMVVSISGKSSLVARGRILGVKPAHLARGKARWESFIDSGTQLSVLRGKIRSDKHPEEWTEWITTVAWLLPEVSRGAVNKNDWVRNPNDRSDKRQCRVHWLETKVEEAVAKIWDLGRRAFPPDYQYHDGKRREFEVSHTVIAQLKHFSVKRPSRETSLCRYHMEWTNLHSAMYRYRCKLKPLTCQHRIEKDPYVIRRGLVCRPPDEGGSDDDEDDEDDDSGDNDDNNDDDNDVDIDDDDDDIIDMVDEALGEPGKPDQPDQPKHPAAQTSSRGEPKVPITRLFPLFTTRGMADGKIDAEPDTNDEVSEVQLESTQQSFIFLSSGSFQK